MVELVTLIAHVDLSNTIFHNNISNSNSSNIKGVDVNSNLKNENFFPQNSKFEISKLVLNNQNNIIG